MSCIVLEPRLEQRLKAVVEPIELVDHLGNVVGVFTPVREFRPISWISHAEMDLCPAVSEGSRLDEILAAWEIMKGAPV